MKQPYQLLNKNNEELKRLAAVESLMEVSAEENVSLTFNLSSLIFTLVLQLFLSCEYILKKYHRHLDSRKNHCISPPNTIKRNVSDDQLTNVRFRLFLPSLEIKHYQFGRRAAFEVAKSREQLRGERDNWPRVNRRRPIIAGDIVKFEVL